MKFLIEIGGATQPDLIRALDTARARLIEGGCFLNQGGCTEVVMRPATDADEDEFRTQFRDAHPKPTVGWSK